MGNYLNQLAPAISTTIPSTPNPTSPSTFYTYCYTGPGCQRENLISTNSTNLYECVKYGGTDPFKQSKKYVYS